MPAAEEERIFGVFYGRVASRADFWCAMGDRLPGTSGTAVAEQFFSAVPPDFESHPTKRYYPAVATRMPGFMMRAPAAARRCRAETEALWEPELSRIAEADLPEALGRFRAAVERFEDSVYRQGAAVLSVVQPIYDQLTKLVAGLDGVGAELMSGHGEHEESQMIEDLWACSRGRIGMDAVIARHGYHGPQEGEISALVWREDPSPLCRILEAYRALGDDADPARAQAARVAQRQQAEAQVLARLKGPQRAKARAILALAGRYVPLRGVGKMAFLQNLDLARAAARRTGTNLAAQKVLADPSDVFFLTVDELSAGRWDGVADLVEFRRERRRAYEAIELPTVWKGTPIATASREDETGAAYQLEGIGASRGMAEARVRVVSDPGEAVVEPGEILVAHTTDPSWASVLFLCSALVVDIGGMLSHAAVVARELGVPCVVNTKIGTKVLQTGDFCRVDGSSGRIEILKRAGS
ncbi:MAG: PEP-utilizing enzyme [Actinomycetota bacterium]